MHMITFLLLYVLQCFSLLKIIMMKLLLCQKYIEIGFVVRWQEKKNTIRLDYFFFCKNSCPKIRPANSENSQDGLVPHGQLNT